MHEEGDNEKNPVLEIKNVATWWGLRQKLESVWGQTKDLGQSPLISCGSEGHVKFII